MVQQRLAADGACRRCTAADSRPDPPQSGVPEGFESATLEGALRISWRAPSQWVCTAGGASGLALASGLLACFALNSQQGAASLLFALVALVSAYALLVGLLNRTFVQVDGGCLAVGQGPLPCPLRRLFQVRRNRSVAVSQVCRLHIEPERRHDAEAGTYHTYGLQAETVAGARVALLTRLGKREVAYLAAELQSFLGLEL